MKKIWLLLLMVGALALLFNVLFFLLGGNQPVASVWISYAFIHIGFLQALLIPFLVPKSRSSHVFAETVTTISVAFLIATLVLGILFIFLRLENWKLTLIAHLIVLFAFFIVLVVTHFTNTHTARQEGSKAEYQRAFKEATLKLNEAIVYAEAKDKPYLQSILADIKASPIMTSKGLQGIENNIVVECEEILNAAKGGDSNAIRAHGAVVSQLVLLRKQNPSE